MADPRGRRQHGARMAEPGRDDHRDGPRQSPVLLNMFKISESLPGTSRLIPVDHGRPRHIPTSTPGRARHTRMLPPGSAGLYRDPGVTVA